MTEPKKKQLRAIDAPFVAPGPSGVAIRDRLKHLTPEDEKVLRLVGAHLGSLASRDLKARCATGWSTTADTWAARKRELTAESSSRWAGSITKATHDQWALARRCQLAHIQVLEAGIAHARAPAVPADRGEGHQAGAGRLPVRRASGSPSPAACTCWRTGWPRRGPTGRPGACAWCAAASELLNTRHHLDAARLTEPSGGERWEAERWFLAADGESGKRFGNETIRVTPGRRGQHQAARAARRTWPTPRTAGTSWPPGSRSRTGARSGPTAIDGEPGGGLPHPPRRGPGPLVPDRLLAAPRRHRPSRWRPRRAEGMVGVDTNADHLAAWRLDAHGNPVGEPAPLLLRPVRHRRPP